MLPTQQSASLPTRVEANSSIQSHELLQLLQTPPIVKISNVQDKPTTSRKPRAKAQKIESRQQQKEVLTSLLLIMFEKKTFTHFEEKITDIELSKANERFYRFEYLSSTLRAKSSLFNMKNRMAEIIAFANDKTKREKVTEMKESMKLFIASFIKEGMNYNQLLTILNSHKKNEIQGKNILANRSYAPRKAERSKNKLRIAQQRYDATLKATGVTEEQIHEYMTKCLHNKAFMGTVRKAFSCILSDNEINNIITAVKTAKVSIEPILPSVQPTQLAQETTRFKMTRSPVTDALWQVLQEPSSEDEYINTFYEFVYTNWNDDCEQKKISLNDLRNDPEGKLLKGRYDTLLINCFREQVKLSAINLVYYISQVKKLHAELKKAKGISWNDKMIQRDDVIRKILSIAKKEFSKNYILYRKKIENPPQLSKIAVKQLKKKMDKITTAYQQVKSELDIHNDLIFIDEVIDCLKNNNRVDRADILRLIEKNLSFEPDALGECAAKRRHSELSNESDQPLQKKAVQQINEDIILIDDEISFSLDEVLLEEELISSQAPSSSQNTKLNFGQQQEVYSQHSESEVFAELFPRLTDLFHTNESQNVFDIHMLPTFMREPTEEN